MATIKIGTKYNKGQSIGNVSVKEQKFPVLVTVFTETNDLVRENVPLWILRRFSRVIRNNRNFPKASWIADEDLAKRQIFMLPFSDRQPPSVEATAFIIDWMIEHKHASYEEPLHLPLAKSFGSQVQIIAACNALDVIAVQPRLVQEATEHIRMAGNPVSPKELQLLVKLLPLDHRFVGAVISNLNYRLRTRKITPSQATSIDHFVSTHPQLAEKFHDNWDKQTSKAHE